MASRSRKGCPNLVTTDLKHMILMALDHAGGVGYLLKQANKNPSSYMALLAKILPTALANDDKNPITPPLSDADKALINRYLEAHNGRTHGSATDSAKQG